MNVRQAMCEIDRIRELMERPIRYRATSGTGAILAGVAALAGCYLDARFSELYESDRPRALLANGLVWAGVLVAASGSVLALSRVRERRSGLPFWTSAKVRMLRAVLPGFLAAAGLTLAIAWRWYQEIGPNSWGLIPAIWMLFYGVACWQAAEFSIAELRFLGAAFVAAGLAAAFDFQTRPYLALGATFGGFHVVYGAVVWVRHGG